MIENAKGDTQMDATTAIEANTAPDDRDWSLVTITNKGTVSILKNLDTYTARETYKRLRPDRYPTEVIWPACGGHSWEGGGYSYHSSSITSVEIIGPAGQSLDPWFGVEPRVVNLAAEHEMRVAAGITRCDICGDPEKREAIKEERHRKELLKAVPLAFWLEDANAC